MRRALLALALLLGPAAAQAAAGQVLFALGPVEIKRSGQAIVVARGTAVEVGDTLSTGPTGMTQVRMKDGALLSLRYGSSMVIEEFKLPAAAPAAPAAARTVASGPSATTAGGRSVLRLLRGAFRTVTGLIGKGASDTYSVITPVATIGIRGTDYSAAYCSGDCGTTPDGLYLGVSNGEIAVDNGGGQLVLTNDQYGYVKDQSTAPNQELAPPEVLETPIAPSESDESAADGAATGADTNGDTGGDSAQAGAGDGDAGEAPPESGFAEETRTQGAVEAGSAQPEGDYELLPGSPGTFAFARGGGKGSGDNGVYTDDSGALNGFLTGVFTSIGTAQNVNRGSHESGLNWGRWSGGIASVGGSGLDLQNASLHWIYADTRSTPALPVGGTLSYTLVGNTDPTDNAGHVGFLGSATFSADFTSGSGVVTSTLNLGIGDSGTAGSQVWQASGSGSVGAGTLFSGTYGSVSVTTLGGGTVSGTGAFAGFFTDGAAAAGLTYDLSDGNTTVSGAAAFGDPRVVQP